MTEQHFQLEGCCIHCNSNIYHDGDNNVLVFTGPEDCICELPITPRYLNGWNVTQLNRLIDLHLIVLASNNLSCPDCDGELQDIKTITSQDYPPVVLTYCSGCGVIAYRFV